MITLLRPPSDCHVLTACLLGHHTIALLGAVVGAGVTGPMIRWPRNALLGGSRALRAREVFPATVCPPLASSI